jgi:hypothetical protein
MRANEGWNVYCENPQFTEEMRRCGEEETRRELYD